MSIDERLQRIESLVLLSCKQALNTKDVALLLDISESRVRHLVSDRLIPHYKQGYKVFFKKSEIEDWMLEHHVKTTAQLKSEAATYTTLHR